MKSNNKFEFTTFIAFALILGACSSGDSSHGIESSSTGLSSIVDSSLSLSSEISDERYEIYLLALNAGFTGTYQEWLDSIKGDQGESGTDGLTPYIGENGNWWIGEDDTGVYAGNQDAIPQTGEFQYAVNSDGQSYYLTKYIGKDRFVRIPQTYNGYPVTSIGPSAFVNNGYIENIELPATITNIESYAFSGNYQLLKINVPDNIESIGAYAFNQTGISEFEMPPQLKTIGESAFRNSFVTTIEIPIGVKIISDYLFAETPLSNITIPEGVTTIGSNAFRNTNITTITLPSSLTTIRTRAFNVMGLTSIIIPENVETIGEYIFNNFLTVYVRVSVIPVGWNNRWATLQYSTLAIIVVWGYSD
jgi:hypothetical protein